MQNYEWGFGNAECGIIQMWNAEFGMGMELRVAGYGVRVGD